MTRMCLPAPSPYTGERECPACQGRKVSGWRVDFMHRLVVDVFCVACGGCGRHPASHDGCEPAEHADWDPVDHLPDDDELLAPGAPCASCWGRGWFAVQAWPRDRRVVYQLRVPCGCASGQLVPAPAGGAEVGS